MKIEATFVRSAAGASDLPNDGLAEVAMIGRSNVGKSSLINALVRQKVARTSAAPGKTRLANIYRIARGTSPPFYLVDLPGYGYARGGAGSAREFEELTRTYFTGRSPKGFALQPPEREAFRRPVSASAERSTEREGFSRAVSASAERSTEREGFSRAISALLLVDARHPGLESDLAAWTWLKGTVEASALVATKIDKLARGERIRAMRELQSVFDDPVLPVSAATGEGLDELWKLIDRLATRRNSNSSRAANNNRPSSLPRGTAPRPPEAPVSRPRPRK